MSSGTRTTAAQKQADRATSDYDKAAWLRIAQGWLTMLTRPARTAEQKFNDETTDRQTGPGSDKSN